MKIKAMIIAVGGMLFAVLGLLVMMCVFMAEDDDGNDGIGTYYTIGVSAEVLAYQPLIEHYAALYGISDYVPYLLAIMQVESGGTGTDPMQSSESMGLPVNTLTPEASIEQGCKHFANFLTMATNKGCDIDTAVQSYNYGTGFINYVAGSGCNYTFELAESFSQQQANGVRVTYTNPIAVAKNGGWRYKYGNMFYVSLVKQYLAVSGIISEFGEAVINEALKYQGYPYVFGGTAPYSFDCSGLTQWCYSTAGVSLPRTAQGQYDALIHIPLSEAQPGDLVFFTGTYSAGRYITHVGIYVGNNRMFHAGSPLGYADLGSSYWQTHIVCAGTLGTGE